jgi:hypothetical protein
MIFILTKEDTSKYTTGTMKILSKQNITDFHKHFVCGPGSNDRTAILEQSGAETDLVVFEK